MVYWGFLLPKNQALFFGYSEMVFILVHNLLVGDVSFSQHSETCETTNFEGVGCHLCCHLENCLLVEIRRTP